MSCGRSIKELEAAGVVAIEIEDTIAPCDSMPKTRGLHATAEQVGKAGGDGVRAHRAHDCHRRPHGRPDLWLSGRALTGCELRPDGVEAIRLVLADPRSQLEAVHRATSLPLTVLSPPPDLLHDRAFLAAHGVRVLMLGNPASPWPSKRCTMASSHLKDGGAVEDLADQQASADLLRAVNRTEEFLHWQQGYLRA